MVVCLCDLSPRRSIIGDQIPQIDVEEDVSPNSVELAEECVALVDVIVPYNAVNGCCDYVIPLEVFV